MKQLPDAEHRVVFRRELALATAVVVNSFGVVLML